MPVLYRSLPVPNSSVGMYAWIEIERWCSVWDVDSDSSADATQVLIYYLEQWTQNQTKSCSSDNESIKKESDAQGFEIKTTQEGNEAFVQRQERIPALSYSAFNSQRSFRLKTQHWKYIQSSFTSPLFQIRCRPTKRKRRKHTILNFPEFPCSLH